MRKEYRLVVAGCRNFNDYHKLDAELRNLIKEIDSDYTVIIISGGASGTDSLGEQFAQRHHLQIERFPAEWGRYGRSAGPRRNAKMAQAADGVIVFWDGKSKGTKSMIEYAKKYQKPYRVIDINPLCTNYNRTPRGCVFCFKF